MQSIYTQMIPARLRSHLRTTAQSSVACALCTLLAVGPALAAEPAPRVIPAEAHTAALTQQERVLHALNRFTFGPRPGDEAVVERMGLDRWFELQLHPERIDDAALDQKLQAYPAMQLSTEQLLARFPSPQRLRQEMRQHNADMPTDPAERAIYADSLATYEARKKQDEAGAPAATPAAQQGADAATPAQQAAAGEAALSEAMNAPADTSMAAVDGKGKRARQRAQPMDDDAVEAILALPPDARMQQMEAMSPADAASFRASLRAGQRARLLQGLSPAQVETLAAMQSPERVVAAEALESRLVRDIYSQRQLQAVMTDFWLNHFSVYLRKNQQEPYYLPSYQREVILPRSLGKFEDLLVATAQSPAMLMYLDNWESIGPDSLVAQRVKRISQFNANGKIAKNLPKGINENYARELMELHTLGVNGGYTQQDVIQVARCFTGWTIDRPYRGGGGEGTPGQFLFEPNRHEPGDKLVLGHVIHSGGMDEGLAVLHILATSPATAHFVSQKLAVRFVSDTPPPALVDAMAATFLKSDGDIRAVLETMFHSPLFWSPQVYRAKVKTPIEFLVSALRASDASVQNAVPLVQAMARLGMPVYGMQTPNGYGWTADQWVSSNALIARMNFALVLSGGRLPGTQTNWPALLGTTAASGAAVDPTPADEARLEHDLLGQPASPRTRQTVLAQFNNPTAQREAEANFNASATADEPSSPAEEPAMNANGGLLRVGGRSEGLRAGLQANHPETPLDTMAGLLLGSPDFQRR